MLKLLQEISKRTLLLNEYSFTDEQMHSKWLGLGSASDEEIEAAKASLKSDLPTDYIEFLKITNGFPQCTSTGITFLPVDKVDYLINVDEDLVEIWNDRDELKNIGQALSESLLIGGLNEEQYFLLIPPNAVVNKWRYWEFASWIPGEHEFKTLNDYFKSELSFLKEETKGLKMPKPKPEIDYSLRDHVFNQDWENTFYTAFKFLQENKLYGYFGGHIDLLKLLLLSASKLNSFEQLEKKLNILKVSNQYDGLNELIIQFEDAAKKRITYISDFQMKKFTLKESPMTLDQVEAQTRIYRQDLLKPKNALAKANYQLYFLFEYGSSYDFIKLYEANREIPYFDSHLKAAIVYATLDQLSGAQKALERYYETAFSYRPLDPFLDNVLINVIEKDFSRKMLTKMKPNNI